MKWNHILDKQPSDNSVIIQIDKPYDCYKNEFTKHYTMGMRLFKMYGTWEDYLKFLEENSTTIDFWWIYAKDFPFPGKEINS